MGRHPIKVVGIDLAGSEKRPTRMCFLQGNQARVSVVHTDDEILKGIREDVRAIVIGDPEEGLMILPRK